MAYLERLSAQARELFAHLPAGIVGDDEALHFTVNSDGSLSVVVDRTGDLLSLFQGYGVRCRHTSNGVEVEVYQGGRLVELLPVVLAPPDMEDVWQRAPSAG